MEDGQKTHGRPQMSIARNQIHSNMSKNANSTQPNSLRKKEGPKIGPTTSSTSTKNESGTSDSLSSLLRAGQKTSTNNLHENLKDGGKATGLEC